MESRIKSISKNFNLSALGSFLLLLASCESSDSINNENNNELKKIVTITTFSANPEYNTKNVKRYINFEVVSDSTFDYQGQFLYRNEITTNNGIKAYKTYSNTGELSQHREENYDTQGRLIGRHTYLPPSALYFTYIYNDNGTVDSKYYNELDGQTITFRTFTKNSNGLLFRNNYSTYNSSTGQSQNFEDNANIQNQKLISVTQSQVTTNFEYYPNPMPSNLRKTVNELNNLIVMGNELRYLAYDGNYYYKENDTDITTFNSDNYKTYFKSVYTNNHVTPNTTTTTEKFYYYE